MSLIWLAAWLIRRRPRVKMVKSWNDWGIALAVCLALDLMSSATRSAQAGRRARKELEPAAEPAQVAVPLK